jgi:hypothetical protein
MLIKDEVINYENILFRVNYKKHSRISTSMHSFIFSFIWNNITNQAYRFYAQYEVRMLIIFQRGDELLF